MAWSTADSARMKRVFGANLEIIEATLPLQTYVRPANMRGAKPDSAVCCGIAKALGGRDVAIMQTCTYIRDGKHVIKYANGDDAKAFIKMFDTGGLKLSAPMRVTFLPVPKSHTRVQAHKRHKALKKRIASGKKPRAYAKPTAARGSKVQVYHAKSHRTIVTDLKGRCAARWSGL